MPEQKKLSKTGVTPGKLALVVVLAVVFTVVLIVQFGGSSGEEETVQLRPPCKAPLRTPGGGTTAQVAQLRTSLAPWPTLERDDVLRYDPFKTPSSFLIQHQASATAAEASRTHSARGREEELKRKMTEREQALDALKKEGVKAVLGSSKKGNVAVIGSQSVHVGDVFQGFRVVAIEPDGVVLEQLSLE